MTNITTSAYLRYSMTVITVLFTTGCFATESSLRTERPIDSIGTAAMSADGLITVQIRMDSAGAIGDVLYEIGPDDPRYQIVIERVGGLVAGEEKFIPALEKQ